MNSTNVCPNCGPCGEGHRCLSIGKDMINQIDDDGGSTPFLDEVVKESMSYDESASTSVQRNDFAISDIEKSQESSMEKMEDGLDSLRLHSFKENPIISGGNPDSPPDEESFMEENQEDASEDNRASFRKDIRVVTSKHDCRGSLLTPFPESNEHPDTSEGMSMALSSDSQAAPSKKDCGKTFASKESYADHRMLHGHSYSSKEASADLPSSSQAGPSRLCSSRHSGADSAKSPIKPIHCQSFFCNICEKKLASNRSLQIHRFLHQEVKPYACKECAKTLAQKSCPKTHNRGHTGERSYKCNGCGKKISQSCNLKTHFRLRPGDKSFKCSVCERDFIYEILECRHSRRQTI